MDLLKISFFAIGLGIGGCMTYYWFLPLSARIKSLEEDAKKLFMDLENIKKTV